MSFEFIKLDIPDVAVVRPSVFNDERGFFMETYKLSEFSLYGISYNFVQDNHSKSKKGVLRGLHYQLNPKAQGKLIRCVKGRIWDVAVDIRKGSPWYGKWAAAELSEQNRLSMWIPPGFAHGFLVLSDEAEVVYKITEEYAPEFERGIIWNDPEIGIPWMNNNPIISAKDAKLPLLREAENNFYYKG